MHVFLVKYLKKFDFVIHGKRRDRELVLFLKGDTNNSKNGRNACILILENEEKIGQKGTAMKMRVGKFYYAYKKNY